jgi:hypothetical protein
MTRYLRCGIGEGQADGGGDTVRAVQEPPDLWLPHQAGGAYWDRQHVLSALTINKAWDRLTATFEMREV